MQEIDHEYTREPVCPYCGYVFTDAWELDDSTDIECYRCEKEIHIERNVRVDWTTSKVLN